MSVCPYDEGSQSFSESSWMLRIGVAFILQGNLASTPMQEFCIDITAKIDFKKTRKIHEIL